MDWADQYAKGEVSYLGRWKSSHPLVRFGEHFWMDMCRTVYEWRGLSLPTHQRAAEFEMYYELPSPNRPHFSPELRSLMYRLIEWLNLTRSPWNYDPDKLRVGDTSPERQLLVREILRLCETTAKWAASVNLPDLQFESMRASEALRRVG